MKFATLKDGTLDGRLVLVSAKARRRAADHRLMIDAAAQPSPTRCRSL
jgi:hypothetical protein